MSVRRRAVVALATFALLAFPAPLVAQDEEALAAECAGDADCLRAAQAVEIVQPRLGIALAGGNPVPGTASTLGPRIGVLPRLSVSGRITAVRFELPPVLNGGGEASHLILPSVNGDLAVGLFPGFSLAPTVGGVGSLDLLASAGFLPLFGDEFRSELPLSGALGLRLGLLRESFTLPGVSISAMYRYLGEVTYGDPALEESDSYFSADLGMIALRAAASKRLFGFGATAGVGYARFNSDVEFAAAPGEVHRLDGFTNDRFTAYVNASWTLLILSVVGELGWQSGGEVVPGLDAEALAADPERGAFFASFAIRLSI